MCDSDRWPIPPIWPEDLPPIRQLMSPRAFQRLLEQHPEMPHGPKSDGSKYRDQSTITPPCEALRR
jgi:hypothetical protein